MKMKEELNALKEEVETLNMELQALTDEELKQVAGGSSAARCPMGCDKIGRPSCLECTNKTLIRVTVNCFEIYRCDLGFGKGIVC